MSQTELRVVRLERSVNQSRSKKVARALQEPNEQPATER
jgi:hypothetical protein